MRIVIIQIRAMMDAIDIIRDETAEITEIDMDIVDGPHQSPAMTAMESKRSLVDLQFYTNVTSTNRMHSIFSEQVNYRSQKPSNKIIVLGLAKHLTEADVSDSILFLFFI